MALELPDYLGALGGLQNLPDSFRSRNEAIASRLGLQRGALQNTQIGLQNEAMREKAQQEAEYRQSVQAVLTNPTAQGYASLMTRFPEYAKEAQAGWNALDANRQQADLTQLGDLYGAAGAGKFDMAASILQRRIDADKAIGDDTEQDETILSMLKSGDPDQQKKAMGVIGLQLSAVTGPDKFAQAYGALTKGQEGYTLAPGNRRYDAEGNLVAEAPFAPEYRNVGEGDTLVQVGGGNTAASAGGNAKGSFDSFYKDFLAPTEGGFADRDGMSGAPVNFGVNQKANPDIDVKSLTQSKARAILKERYWEKSGANRLPAGLAEIQADTAVNMGVGTAQRLLKQSGGDPEKYLQLREARYRSIGGKDLGTWLNRNNSLRQYVGLQDGAPVAGGSRVVAQGAPAEKDAPSGYRWAANGNLEAIPGGPGESKYGQQDRKAETDLRKEFDGLPEVKAFKDVRTAFQQIKSLAGKPSAQNDIAMIFSYMKMLDPGSVVREGEFATAQNAAGIPDQWKNAYNKAVSGERLNPKQRQSMIASAANVYKAQRETYNSAAAKYQGYASEYGLDGKRVARRYVPDAAKPQSGGGFKILRVRPK